MRNFEGQRVSEGAIARAIRSVEQQSRYRIEHSSETTRELRRQFYQTVDRLSPQLFEGIARAAAAGKGEFNLISIPEFRQKCEEIFNLAGIFDPDLLNDWLYSRDLRHLFTSTESSIRW